MALSKIFPKRALGIDIGTSAIKMVELSSFGGKIKLENYGDISSKVFAQKSFKILEKDSPLALTENIINAAKTLIAEAKIKTKKSVFSIPDFSTFFTTIELPLMSREEIPFALKAEAKRYIPLPLSEVTLDWQLLEEKNKKEKKLKVLLASVPNKVIFQYQNIASNLNLELFSLEAEVFSLIRALLGREEKGVVSLIDIGHRSTTCSIIEKRTLKVSHSLDIGGVFLTEKISECLGTNETMAEHLKKKYGLFTVPLGLEKKEIIKEILLPVIDLILRDIDEIFKNFYYKEGKEVEKIILSGGTAFLPGLLEYFQNHFKKPVEIAQPFSKMLYPPILENTLKELGPPYAVAVGAALRGVE